MCDHLLHSCKPETLSSLMPVMSNSTPCNVCTGVPEGKLPSGDQIKLLRSLLTSVVQGDNIAEAVQQSLLSKPKRQRAAAAS